MNPDDILKLFSNESWAALKGILFYLRANPERLTPLIELVETRRYDPSDFTEYEHGLMQLFFASVSNDTESVEFMRMLMRIMKEMM